MAISGVSTTDYASLLNMDFSKLGSNTADITANYLKQLEGLGNTLSNDYSGIGSMLGGNGNADSVTKQIQEWRKGMGGTASGTYFSDADKAGNEALTACLSGLNVSSLTQATANIDYSAVMNGSMGNSTSGIATTDFTADLSKMAGKNVMDGTGFSSYTEAAAQAQNFMSSGDFSGLMGQVGNAPAAPTGDTGFSTNTSNIMTASQMIAAVGGGPSAPAASNIDGNAYAQAQANAQSVLNGDYSGLASTGLSAQNADIAAMFTGGAAQNADIAAMFTGGAAQNTDIAAMFTGGAAQNTDIAAMFTGGAAQNTDIAAMFTGGGAQNTNIAAMFTQAPASTEQYAQALSNADAMTQSGNYSGLYNNNLLASQEIKNAYTSFMSSYMNSMGVSVEECDKILNFYGASFDSYATAMTGYNNSFAGNITNSYASVTSTVKDATKANTGN